VQPDQLASSAPARVLTAPSSAALAPTKEIVDPASAPLVRISAPAPTSGVAKRKQPRFIGRATAADEPPSHARRRGRDPSAEFDQACRDDPRSQECAGFLAPLTCSSANPFRDNRNPDDPSQPGVGSCDYLLDVNPCYGSPDSTACHDFLQNPCFLRPDGPACFETNGRSLEAAGGPGCDYLNPHVSQRCEFAIAVGLDYCEQRPQRCGPPFGGVQDRLTLVSETQGRGRRPPSGDNGLNGGGRSTGTPLAQLSVATGRSHNRGGSHATGGPQTRRPSPREPAALAVTGLDLLPLLAWGLAFVASGSVIRLAVRRLTERRAVPPAEGTS
jgi:hypothetical protein